MVKLGLLQEVPFDVAHSGCGAAARSEEHCFSMKDAKHFCKLLQGIHQVDRLNMSLKQARLKHRPPVARASCLKRRAGLLQELGCAGLDLL